VQQFFILKETGEEFVW